MVQKVPGYSLLSVLSFAFLGVFYTQFVRAATPPSSPYHLAPSHWYTGFQDSTLEIVIHAENIDLFEITMSDYDGVTFLDKTNSANRHIAYLHLIIGKNARPGILKFNAKPASRRTRYVKSFHFVYSLYARNSVTDKVSASDIVYRINSDRFSNGSERNDNLGRAGQVRVSRNNPEARHGGDLIGITNNLDYIKNLGVTTLWLESIQENDHPIKSFLGNSITNHYDVDARLGGIEAALHLREEMRKKNLKLMMDLNINHVGVFHWMYQNFDTGWFNNFDSSVNPIPDPDYLTHPGLSEQEMIWISSRWTDLTLPDFNQNNPHIFRFLKQNTMWWTEFLGISAWSISNFQTLFPGFCNQLIHELKPEFPNSLFIANTKTNDILAQAEFTQNNIQKTCSVGFDFVSDFILESALQQITCVTSCNPDGWSNLFSAIESQILYKNPDNRLTFFDDPESMRIASMSQSNPDKWKMATTLLFTLPGTPVLLYGTEVLLNDTFTPKNTLSDFPGGWNSDKQSFFENNTGNKNVQTAYSFLQKCIYIKKSNVVLQKGNLIPYAPADGIFSYFRTYNQKTIFIISNDNATNRIVNVKRFEHELSPFSKYNNILNKETGSLNQNLDIPAHTVWVLELMK